MQLKRPSRTAEYMALYRAMESARPSGDRLFTDPLAVHFLGPSLRRAVALSRIPFLAPAIAWYADYRAPGARTSAIARTRFIDDIVCRDVRDGTRQVVTLGAGFDCRFYRLQELGSVAGFEVDHPSTLALKISRLRTLLEKATTNVRFVAIDFEHQKLADRLLAEGFDRRQPAIFIWEGVTNYLTPEAVDAVLQYVSDCAPRSRLVFTYVHRGAINHSGQFPDAAKIMQNVARLGEPWIYGLIPAKLPSFLHNRGLRLEQDHGANEYRRTYFGRAAESMSGYDFYHVSVASVPERT